MTNMLEAINKDMREKQLAVTFQEFMDEYPWLDIIANQLHKAGHGTVKRTDPDRFNLINEKICEAYNDERENGKRDPEKAVHEHVEDWLAQ